MNTLQLRGIVPPVLTPLNGPDRLDRDGLERLLEHLIDGGVHGLFVLGTSGEGPSLSHRLQRDVVTAAAEINRGRVPLLIGVTDTSCVESVGLAKHSADAGADAVVIAPPYYFPAGQTELVQYVERLVSQIPLPSLLYNMPSLTKVEFSHDTLKRLASVDAIVGVKDSGGDLAYYEQLCQLKGTRPDWSVLVGPEHLLARSMRLGGDGGVHGGANIFPKLFTRLFAAIDAGQSEAVAALENQVDKLQAIYEVGKYPSRFIKAMKSAVSIRGLCGDELAEPFNRFLKAERDRVADVLDSLDPALVL